MLPFPATTRHLYLPSGHWYDFWTGAKLTGGRMLDAAAPLDRIPLYMRAGSIGPVRSGDRVRRAEGGRPIELRVCTGADGDFTLYEDENDNHNYEKGAYATITFHWNDATRQRRGNYCAHAKMKSLWRTGMQASKS